MVNTPTEEGKFQVTIKGFKTERQALEFLQWYEGGGEQAFGDHLDIVDMTSDDGCYIDVNHKGNHRGKGGCYDKFVNGFVAHVK